MVLDTQTSYYVDCIELGTNMLWESSVFQDKLAEGKIKGEEETSIKQIFGELSKLCRDLLQEKFNIVSDSSIVPPQVTSIIKSEIKRKFREQSTFEDNFFR